VAPLQEEEELKPKKDDPTSKKVVARNKELADEIQRSL
jgi:hypothetical protein